MYKINVNEFLEKGHPLVINCLDFIKDYKTFFGWLLTLTEDEYQELFQALDNKNNFLLDNLALILYSKGDLESVQFTEELIQPSFDRVYMNICIIDMYKEGLLKIDERSEKDEEWVFSKTKKAVEFVEKIDGKCI